MSARYSAIAAKLKAMCAPSLTKQDFISLTEKKTVSEICTYLKATEAYGEAFSGMDENNAHRGQMEYLMNEKLFYDFVKIYRFMDNQNSDLIRFFFIRREIEFLKREIHYIYTKEEHTGRRWTEEEFKSNFFVNGDKIKWDAVQNAKSLEDCVEACRGSMYEEPLKRAVDFKADFFMLGMIFDDYYYRNLWKTINALPKNEAEGFKKIVGADIDMLNIMWIYRGKKYFNFANEAIFAYLLPVRHRLSESQIRSLVNSSDEESFIAAVQSTPYAGLVEGINDGLAIEENFEYMMGKVAKNVFRSASLSAIFAYAKLKEWEIWRITTVIEGVRYGRSPGLIRKHIRTAEERGVA